MANNNDIFDKIAKLPKVWSVTLLVLFIVFLYVTLQKVIMPGVMAVVQSGFFFEKEEEPEELGIINNARSDEAFARCKSVMVSDKHVPESAQFVDKEYEAWALGGRVYLIRSHVIVNSPENPAQDRKYACKIRFNGGEMNDPKNWESLGVDFNEPG
jgi:hypothetical protein